MRLDEIAATPDGTYAGARFSAVSKDAIKNYIDVSNEDPKPFVWTKTADQILESIKRFCLRTSGTGH